MWTGYPKPIRILFRDTMGIQWVDTDATLWFANSWAMGVRMHPLNRSESAYANLISLHSKKQEIERAMIWMNVLKKTFLLGTEH